MCLVNVLSFAGGQESWGRKPESSHIVGSVKSHVAVCVVKVLRMVLAVGFFCSSSAILYRKTRLKVFL